MIDTTNRPELAKLITCIGTIADDMDPDDLNNILTKYPMVWHVLFEHGSMEGFTEAGLAQEAAAAETAIKVALATE